MAKQLNFTHPNGTSYPESYWKITKLHVDVLNRYAEFGLTGYKDVAARQSGKDSIGFRQIIVQQGDFDVAFTEVTMKTKNPQEVGYNACALIKDIPDGDEIIDQGLPTERTQPKFRSFFDGALDV